jgi:GTPase Era involved in 16S rRNA processing
MEDIQKSITAFLNVAAERLHSTKFLEEQATQLLQFPEQVYQPCVVAVVGQVKAGKSTFINAFLGEDLAKVGTVETTATINYFRYGKISSERLVRCYWRGGQIEDVDMSFVNSLQGNDLETLQRAEGIERLEYHVLIPQLEQITLVDTPGTGAVVDEHQNRTAEFIHLEHQLRERHNQETQSIGSRADAVIYLIGSIARTSDRDFLKEFQQVTQGRARSFNAVGVIAKIDLDPEVLERRQELAGEIADQLKDYLNTVVPVSAALQRALDHLLRDDMAGFKQLIGTIRHIPLKRLHKFLDNIDLYLESEPPDCPITPSQRRELLGDMDWTVFTTIAHVVAKTDPVLEVNEIIEHLSALTGFEQLREILEQHFFKRSQILRCYRILSDVRQVFNTIKYKRLPELRKNERAARAKQERLLLFIRQARGNPTVAKELEDLILERVISDTQQIELMMGKLERDLESIFHQLEQYSTDFETLRDILNQSDSFTRSELDELKALLGLYGLESHRRLPPGKVSVEYVSERQRVWRQTMVLDASPFRRSKAEKVVSRYSLLLEELQKRGD